MRILFVNERGGYAGGIEQNVADTAAALRRRGHACFLTYARKPDRGDGAGIAGFFDQSFYVEGLDTRSGAGRFAEIARETGPDVVYIHKLRSIAALAGASAGRRTVRFVHDHDLCCPTGLKYFRSNARMCTHRAGWRCYLDGGFLVRDRASRFGFSYASIRDHLRELRANARLDALIAASAFMRDELVQNGVPREKVHVVPIAVPLGPGGPLPLPDAPNILFVGQLIRGKGVDLLLRALANARCTFTAKIVGDGNAAQKLRALCAELGLSERVTFEGWVPNERLSGYYAWAKIVAVPSRWAEPYGMVGLEAMRHGRAVVAFDAGGISQWLEHGRSGLLVRGGDVDAFALAVESLLADSGRTRDMGECAARRVREEFGHDAFVDRIERILAGA